MKKVELKKFMEEMLEGSMTMLLQDGRLLPVAFVYYDNDKLDIIGMPFKDKYQKDEQMTILKKVCKEKKADGIFTIIESWLVTTTNKLDLTIEPSKHSERQECILVIGECKEGNITMVQKFCRNGEDIIFTEKSELDDINSMKFDFGIRNKRKQDEKLKEMS